MHVTVITHRNTLFPRAPKHPTFFANHPPISFDLKPVMPNNENAPLLPREGRDNQQSNGTKFNPLGSSRHLLLGSWINVLLVAAPIAIIGASHQVFVTKATLTTSR